MLKRKKKEKKDEKADTTRQFVGFQIGAELYGVDIHSVQEIDRMHSITKLPKSLPFIEGVINLRGRIVPVIDVAKRFGLNPIEVTRHTRIILVRLADQVIGLIVESVTEVVQLKEEAIDPAPSMAFAVDQRYVEGVGRISEGLIIILNLGHLLSGEEISQLLHHPLS